MILQVCHNPTNKTLTLQVNGSTPPVGSTAIGFFEHDMTPGDILGPLENHVLYHHVRDLYYLGGGENMQAVSILSELVYLEGITVAPATADLAALATQQLTVTYFPADPTVPDVTYESSDEAVATVDEEGLVTAVAAGEATITVTTVQGGFTDTSVITVT